MPRGDQAILKYDAAQLDGGILARWSRYLRPPESATGVVAKLVRKIAAEKKNTRLWGLVALAGLVIILGCVLLRGFGGTTPSSDAIPVTPRRSVTRAPRGSTGANEKASIRAFSADYKILTLRSIFAMDGSSAVRPASAAASSGSGSVQPLAAAGNLTLKGLLGEDARTTAFVEDSAKRLIEVHAGDALGPGRVLELNASELVYAVEGKTIRIHVGQGLDGSSPVGVDPPAIQVAAKSSGHKRHKGSSD